MIYVPPVLEETVRSWVETHRTVGGLLERISQGVFSAVGGGLFLFLPAEFLAELLGGFGHALRQVALADLNDGFHDAA